MPVAFGMNTSSGNFLPIIKYDARAGRLFKVDRDAQGVNQQVDITSPTLQFAIDFGTFEVGFVNFTAQGPVRAMVPFGGHIPDQPQTVDDKGKLVSRPGFYALVAGNAIDGIREWCSNAAILLGALDDLWQEFAEAPDAKAGLIPLISIISAIPVKSGSGATTSTNYRPVFKIVGWVERLPGMGERTIAPPGGVLPPSEPKQPAQPGQASAAAAAPANRVPADAMPF